MALPQWNQVGVNFGGSAQSMANATRSVGQVGDIANSMINQKNKEDDLALRNQQLQMQQAAEGRAAEQFGIMKNEKDAANQYAGLLRSATDGNVVGLSDQAKLAQISQDPRLSPEQKTTAINNALPAMTKKYEASPDAQLQVLRGLNAPAAINPATGMALLKEAEQPMEKMQAANAAHAAKLEEEKVRANERLQQQKLMYGLQLGLKNAELAGREREGKLNRDNQVFLKGLEYNAPTYMADVDGVNKVLSPNQLMEVQKTGATISGLTKIGMPHTGGDGTGGSGGSGNGTHKKNEVKNDGSIETFSGVNIPKQGILGFTGDQEETARIADSLSATGYKTKEIQTAVNNQGALDWDAGLKVGNIDKFLPPKVLGDGTIIAPSVAIQIPKMLGKTIYSDNNGKLKFTKGNRELSSDDLETLGFKPVVSTTTEGKQVKSFMPAPEYDMSTGAGSMPDFGNGVEDRRTSTPYLFEMFNDAKNKVQEAQTNLRNRTPNTLLKYN